MNVTLNNGLKLLMVMANAPHPHRISELAKEMNLPNSHIHRLLQTLVENRYVEQDSSRRYAIGLGALRLGHSLLQNIPMRSLGLPGLTRLVDKCGWVSSLSVPFGLETMCIGRVTRNGTVKSTSDTLGKLSCPYSTAGGKLFLAHASHQIRETILNGLTFKAKGPNTHPDAASLCSDLDDIIKRGYSYNDQENGVDNYSLAVPILNSHATIIGAFGISSHLPVPPTELERKLLIAELRREADLLTHELNLNKQEHLTCPPPTTSLS